MPDGYDTGYANAGTPPLRRAPQAPRWVKVFASVGLVLLALLVVMLLLQRGGHGPGRHFFGQGLERAEVSVASIGAAS